MNGVAEQWSPAAAACASSAGWRQLGAQSPGGIEFRRQPLLSLNHLLHVVDGASRRVGYQKIDDHNHTAHGSVHCVSLGRVFVCKIHGKSNNEEFFCTEDCRNSQSISSISSTPMAGVSTRARYTRQEVGLGLRRQERNPASHASTCFYSRKVQPGRFGNAGRVSCVMESMEMSEEQIHEVEQQLLEEEQEGELYLGKEESFEVADSIDDSETVPPEIRECWDLWQRVGLPVAKIAKQRSMTETGVFYCIFSCIQNDFYVDWYELCKEAQFTPEIAKRLIQATEKLVAEAKGAPIEWGPLMKLGSSGVTEVHFGLYMTMLRCGFSYQTILNIASQRDDSQPVTDWGTADTIDERFPTHISEAGMIQWLLEKDGASLLEIALKYRECDEVELMRLLLHLEKVGKIFRRQGIFRAL